LEQTLRTVATQPYTKVHTLVLPKSKP